MSKTKPSPPPRPAPPTAAPKATHTLNAWAERDAEVAKVAKDAKDAKDAKVAKYAKDAKDAVTAAREKSEAEVAGWPVRKEGADPEVATYFKTSQTPPTPPRPVPRARQGQGNVSGRS